MAKPETPRSVVEQTIDSILSGKMTAATAVDSFLTETPKGKTEGGAKELPESIDLKEGEDLVCPQCGGTDFEEGFVESEDGEKLRALRCTECDLGLVETVGNEDNEGEPELVEAEIDENDPHCPACNADDLSADLVESDGEQHMVISCGACGQKMVVAD